MSKTFTCRELGGVCEAGFTGETLQEVMQKAMPHMHADEEHKQHVANLSDSSGESKEQWMERMQQEFDSKPEDK